MSFVNVEIKNLEKNSCYKNVRNLPIWQNYVDVRASLENVLASSRRPHLVLYVTLRDAYGVGRPSDVLRTSI